MKTIYKFAILNPKQIVFDIPKDSKILTVQTQGGIPCIWVLVDPSAEKETRHFEIFGTGHEIPNIKDDFYREYIGTFQLQGGTLVYHLFEIGIVKKRPRTIPC